MYLLVPHGGPLDATGPRLGDYFVMWTVGRSAPKWQKYGSSFIAVVHYISSVSAGCRVDEARTTSRQHNSDRLSH